MAYRIQIREAESTADKTWHDVTDSIVRTGFKTRSGFSSLGSSADLGKLSLTYRTFDLATAAIFGTTIKRVRVIENDAIIFEGYSDSASTVDSSEMDRLAWVKLTAYPYVKALEDVVLSEDFVAYDMTAKSTVEALWGKALDNAKAWIKEAIEESVSITFPSISENIPLVKVAKGDKPLDAMIALLSEHCYSMITYGSGRIAFIKPYGADPLTYASIPFGSLYTKPTIKTAPYIKTKAPQVTLSRTVVHDDVELYSLATEEGKNAEQKIEASGFYPEEGDAEVSYSNSDIENDFVSFLWANDIELTTKSRRGDNTGDGDISFIRADLLGDKAYYRIKNTSETMYCYLHQLRIKAKRAYFSDTSYVVRTEGEGERTEIETEWIQTSEDAILYAKAIADESRCSTSSLVFKSDRLDGINPGALVKIGNIPAVYLVQSVEKDLDKGESTYSCVVYDIADISTDTFYRPPSVLNRGPAGKDAPEMYYLWSSSPDKLIAKSKKYWRFSGKKLFMLFHGKVIGDFGMQDWEKSWEKLMESRTETYNFLWAKVGENGEPFRLQGISPMDFSVLATPPSYTVNPRRKDPFTMTVKLTRLNGIKGASSLELYGGPYDGIVIQSFSDKDEWEILVFQNTTTSLEFKLKASIGGVEKVIGLSGTMIDYDSKYMGAVDTLPTTDEEGNKLLEGDWCVLKSDNLMYVYKSGAWKSITDSEVSSFGELEKMSIALADMIAIGSTKSTTATVLGVFKLLCSDNGFIKFLKTWALYCGAGDENSGFYCRIADHDPTTGQALSKPVFIVKYDGQTVFQIDPSSGNVFMGKPNASLTGAESGFMYDASNKRIVTKDNKLIINEDGSITASDGSFSGNINSDSGTFGGNLSGATGTFTGSFVTPALESRPPALSTTTATLTLPSDASGQFAVLYDNIDKTYQCTLSTDSAIKYITMYKSTMGSTSYYEFYLYDSNMQKKYYNSRRTYKPLIGSAEVKYETTIPAGVLTIGTYGDVLIFKDIPYSSAGLEVGQIYQNTSHQLFIKTE